MAVSSPDLVVLQGASMADRENKSHYKWIILSISPLLYIQGWVRWPNCLSEPASLSLIFSPGRRTSLLWLNRLSRDPISHHLHSPALSPFTTATSSDIRTPPFTHALHGTPMQTHMYKLDAHTALLPPLPSYPSPPHQSAHTHTYFYTHTLRHPWALFPSHLIRPEQTAITVCAPMPISPPISFLICWPARSATTYWPET